MLTFCLIHRSQFDRKKKISFIDLIIFLKLCVGPYLRQKGFLYLLAFWQKQKDSSTDFTLKALVASSWRNG